MAKARRGNMAPPMGTKPKGPAPHSKGGKLIKGKKYACGGKLKKKC